MILALILRVRYKSGKARGARCKHGWNGGGKEETRCSLQTPNKAHAKSHFCNENTVDGTGGHAAVNAFLCVAYGIPFNRQEERRKEKVGKAAKGKVAL